MSIRNRIKVVRLRTRRVWLKAKIKAEDFRLWKLQKEIAYLEWKRSLYERQELLTESRELQGESDE